MRFVVGLSAAVLILSVYTLHADSTLGDFTNQADIGKPALAGTAHFDPNTGANRITAAGKNMWERHDAFHFVWKKMSGDVSLQGSIHWLGKGKNPHRKACLLIRQSLDADAPYADAALHGDGLTSLQYRRQPGGLTYEIQSNVLHPSRIGIEKKGEWFSLSVGTGGLQLQAAGGAMKIKLHEPFYVGLAVCSHDDTVRETAVFTDVHLTNHVPTAGPPVESTLEVVDVTSKNRRVIYHTAGLIEAPNWTHDGRTLLYNAGGHIYRLASTGGRPAQIDTGDANRCNNDHGLSPDNRRLAVSSQQMPDHQSRIYLLPATGGAAKLLTPKGPSYWHGWSPDGQTIVYCAERNGEFDVYSIAVKGGREKRLTTAPGLDDGPEYTPDGQWIYFNSVRTGRMQIWRMRPDGSDQEQITHDRRNNWFAHPSPDGKRMVYLSYDHDVTGHPANQDVELRLMRPDGDHIEWLATVFGGQGTINVPSWSPDSRRVAFVSYRVQPHKAHAGKAEGRFR